MSGFVFDSSMTSREQLSKALNRIDHDGFEKRNLILNDKLLGITISDGRDYFESHELVVLFDGFIVGVSGNNAMYIANLYKQRGIDSFSMINGGFLAVIVDISKSLIYFLKDRFGFGRIQFSIEGHLTAASELKAILETNTNPINCARLHNGLYIVYDFVNDTYEINRFYTHASPEENTLSFEENAKEVRRLMVESVDKILVNNITPPVGVALSGIDSMVLAHLLNHRLGVDNVKLFTVSTTPDTKKNSDLYNLKIFSEFSGNEAHEIIPNLDHEFSIEGLKESVYFFERDDWDGFSNGLVFKLVSEKAGNLGVKTVFDNENVDVYFGSGPIDMAFFYDKDKFWKRRTKRLDVVKCINHRYHNNTKFITADIEQNFVEFCNTVPNRFRRYGGYSNKAVFREAFKGDLPVEIVKRPKIPSIYGAGISDWYTKKDKEDKNFFYSIFKEVFDNGIN